MVLLRWSCYRVAIGGEGGVWCRRDALVADRIWSAINDTDTKARERQVNVLVFLDVAGEIFESTLRTLS